MSLNSYLDVSPEVAAALAAEGETVVENLGIIDRGYWHIAEKLTAIGCDVRRIDE